MLAPVFISISIRLKTDWVQTGGERSFVFSVVSTEAPITNRH